MHQLEAIDSRQGGSEGGEPRDSHIPFGASGYPRKFIDEYLRTRRHDLTDDNRAMLACAIEKYEGGAVVMPGELIAFLDNLLRHGRP